MGNNLDQLFREALGRREATPPEGMWGRIEAGLDRRRLRIMRWKRAVAAAVAVIALAAGGGLLWERSDIPAVMTASSPFRPPLSSPGLPDFRLADGNPVTDLVCTAVTDCAGRFGNDGRVPVAHVFHSVPAIPVAFPADRLPERLEKAGQPIPLVNAEAIRNSREYRKILLEEAGTLPRQGRDLTISLSGHLVTAYSSGHYSSAVKDMRAFSFTDDRMKGMMNVGGGIRLGLSNGRRLSLQTGLLYTRIGRKTSGSASFRNLPVLSDVPEERRMDTPLGDIRPRARYRLDRRFSTKGPDAFSLDGGEELEQVFGTLEIPLNLRYRFLQRKISLSVSGGLSGSILVGNKVFLDTGDAKERVGKTRDIRRFNVSTDLGLGLEYSLGRNVRLMLEPGFRYYLQSMSRNGDIDWKPCLFTLATGVGISF